MKRRRFLALAGRTAAGSWLLGGQAWAQTDETSGDGVDGVDGPPAPVLAEPGETPPLERVPGLSAVEIRLGMSADFSGPGSRVAVEALRGAKVWLDEVNSRGGIYGRHLSLLPQDDGGNLRRAVRNARSFVDTREVFCLFNYVGESTLNAALPVIHGADLSLVGAISGAEAPRLAPFNDQVFSLRPSHRQEMSALVAKLRGARRNGDALRRFGLFYPTGVAGRSAADAALRALEQSDAEAVAEGTYRPERPPLPYVEDAVERLRDHGVQVILCAGQAIACAALARAARERSWNVPLGFAAIDDAELLDTALEGLTADSTAPMLTTRAMPPLEADSLPAIQEYKRLVAEKRPQPPAALASLEVPADHLSAAGLEGFLNARLLTTALDLSGQWPTVQSFRQQLESLGGYDLGINKRLEFSPGHHQGLSTVYCLSRQGESWSSLQDPASPSLAEETDSIDSEINSALDSTPTPESAPGDLQTPADPAASALPSESVDGEAY